MKWGPGISPLGLGFWGGVLAGGLMVDPDVKIESGIFEGKITAIVRGGLIAGSAGLVSAVVVAFVQRYEYDYIEIADTETSRRTGWRRTGAFEEKSSCTSIGERVNPEGSPNPIGNESQNCHRGSQ